MTKVSNVKTPLDWQKTLKVLQSHAVCVTILFASYGTDRKRRQEEIVSIKMVGIAQLVRALDCGSRGRGFESHYPPHIMGCRQAVRHQTLTLAFVGSNPATPAKQTPCSINNYRGLSVLEYTFIFIVCSISIMYHNYQRIT